MGTFWHIWSLFGRHFSCGRVRTVDLVGKSTGFFHVPNHQTWQRWQLEVSSWRIYKWEINEYKWLIFCNATFENTKGKPSKIHQWDLVSGGFTRFDYLRRKGQPETDVDAWFPTKTIHSILSLKKHNQSRCRILGNFLYTQDQNRWMAHGAPFL